MEAEREGRANVISVVREMPEKVKLVRFLTCTRFAAYALGLSVPWYVITPFSLYRWVNQYANSNHIQQNK